ncbi:GntR family transcriptional regulator [Robbsia andropogonis]|nr:GntR family transcriptional regulator [Robbsia andropogonis]MCP1119425.1 GntR family transcriptional regulator [Robbsia andropogonis]MCP1129408.1 GntR family transcriptional regulator [Robbsia andropogonis]
MRAAAQPDSSEKLEHQNLNDRTYAIIKSGLISGSFHPGQYFIIRTVAERYGISPTPVREALQRLVAERLLVMTASRSIIVPTLSADEFTEIYRIRCELEGLAGELAAAHCRTADVNRLTKIMDGIDKAIAGGDKTAYRQLNERFHFSIYEKAGSPRLLEIIQNLWGQVGPVFYGLFDDPDYGGTHANLHHRAIVDALKARDAHAARQRLVDDIVAAREALLPRLQTLIDVDAEAKVLS